MRLAELLHGVYLPESSDHSGVHHLLGTCILGHQVDMGSQLVALISIELLANVRSDILLFLQRNWGFFRAVEGIDVDGVLLNFLVSLIVQVPPPVH
jgi:hypothetical protein